MAEVQVQQKTVPSLRFSEFKNESMLKRIKELATVISGKTPLRSKTYYFNNGKIPWVKTMDLNNSLIEITSENITEEAISELGMKTLPKDTLLIAMYGGFNQIGRTGIINFEGTTNQAIAALIPKRHSFVPTYLQTYLNYNVNQWKRLAASSRKDPNITKKDIENFRVIIPEIDEQKKIGKFFSKINQKLELEEKKLVLLEEQKKGYMQKVFSQEFRFKSENRVDYPKWRKKELKKLLKERKFYENKSQNMPHATLSTEGIGLKKERYNRDFLVKNKNKKYKISYKNDICYNPANLKFGVITRNKLGTIIFSPIYVTFEVQEDNDPLFIELLVTRWNFINRVRKFEEGTVYERMAVKSNDFLSHQIHVPQFEEQQKIGCFFQKIDEHIKLQYQKVKNLKTQKQGLLQKMFI